MRNFLSNFTSLYWWLSVVIVGILINLLSAYLYKKVDKRFSGVSDWWRKKSEAKKARRMEDLNQLRDNPHKQIMASLAEVRHRSRSLMFLLFGILMLGLVQLLKVVDTSGFLEEHRFIGLLFQIVPMIFGVIYILMAYRAHNTAYYIWGLLYECEKDEDKDSDKPAV